jgi:aryl carrier-like protein
VLPTSTDLDSIKEYIQKVVPQLLSVETIGDRSGIYSIGLDSFQALQLSEMLQNAVQSLCTAKGFETITS